VEACIALRIVFVAREFVESGARRGRTSRWRWVVAFFALRILEAEICWAGECAITPDTDDEERISH
jgi:hypothetical protein